MNFYKNRDDISLTLPEVVGVRDIAPLISALSEARAAQGNVELDCSKVRFIDPFGMTALSAAISEVQAQKRRVALTWLDAKTVSYLERMNFFVDNDIDAVDVPVNRQRNDLRSKLLEITHIVDSGTSEAVADQLAAAIVFMIIGRAEKTNNDQAIDLEYDQYYRPLRYALSELIENSLTHARREGAHDASVWVAAQFYKDALVGGRVEVAVVDNGCGFLATLKNHAELPENTHGAAIKTALKPKVSCNRDMGPFGESVNEGVGLTTTVRISKETGGTVHIVSGDALFAENLAIATKRSDQIKVLPGCWDGVAISVTFTGAKLPSVKISDLLPPVGEAKQVKVPVVLRFDE
jgi:ABC-type transporter Mla MlaB component